MASELNNSNPDHDYGKEKLKHSSKEEIVSTTTNSMPRSSSRPQLDVSRAAIQGDSEDRNPTILLPNQSDDISHLAVDIGGLLSNLTFSCPAVSMSNLHDAALVLGSLIKLVYFSRHEEQSPDDKRKRSMKKMFGLSYGNRRTYPILGGRLHFVKFETGKLNECLDFISSKQLHRGGMYWIDSPSWRSGTQTDDNIVIKIYTFYSFDELLELSQQGDSSNVDMLVGDIYGGLDYSKVFNILYLLRFTISYRTGILISSRYGTYRAVPVLYRT
ncbi:hypothetical protein BHE74_00012426, partial [Ensete ventricosum]